MKEWRALRGMNTIERDNEGSLGRTVTSFSLMIKKIAKKIISRTLAKVY